MISPTRLVSEAGPRGAWDGLVVLCAGTAWDGNRFTDQHVAQRLSSYAPVLYVDPPLSLLSPLRRPNAAAALREPRLRLLSPTLARLTPLVQPGPHRTGLHWLTQVMVRRAIRRAVEQLGARVRAVVVISQQYVFGVCGEPHRVLYGTDDYVAGADLLGVSVRHVRRVEQRLLRGATTVLAASPTLVERWRARGYDPVLMPNGVDVEVFVGTDDAPVPDDVQLPAPVAGFVGHLSERIDVDLLRAVADRGRSLLLVGPRQPTFDIASLGDLLERPNVRWVGPKPFEALPSYLRAIDVGLVPYTTSAFNQASFPLKTLEYLAAGRAVVSSDLPASRWLATDQVRIAGGAESFADEVDRALAEVRTPELLARRRAVAAEHTWERRTAHLAELLAIPVPESARL